MISKTGLHAVKALAALAELPEGTPMGAGALAEAIGAPQNYLGKLLRILSHEGLVISQKGLGGGFRLARDPREISLYDVVEPIEHTGRWSGCLMGRDKCSEEDPCAVHDQWKVVRDTYLQFLQSTTIASLAEKPEIELKV
jgi:Rrf2 family iron-sulfur cluster assembly transcriptional regulator